MKAKTYKIIFGTILLASAIWSCGSIKKHKESSETEQKEEFNSGSNKAKWSNSSNYSLEPVDLSKPIVFTNGKGEKQVFENTKVVYNNTHTIERIKDTISANKDLKQESNKKEKVTDNTILILGIILGSIFLVFLFLFLLIVWFINQQSKKTNVILSQFQK